MNKFLKVFLYLLLALMLIIVTAFVYLFFRTSSSPVKETRLSPALEMLMYPTDEFAMAGNHSQSEKNTSYDF